jgi:hypothetical protein
MKSVGLLSVVALVASGCATTSGYEAVLGTWVGDSADHLVSVWGVPAQQYRLDNGGKVLEYQRSGQIVIPGTTTYQPQTTYNNGNVSGTYSNGNSVNGSYSGTSTTYVPQTSAPTVIAQSCVTRFTANAAGRITNWSWQGNSCRSRAPKKAATPVITTTPAPAYQKCTADQIRAGQCS